MKRSKIDYISVLILNVNNLIGCSRRRMISIPIKVMNTNCMLNSKKLSKHNSHSQYENKSINYSIKMN